MKHKVWDFSKLFISNWSPEEQLLIRYRGNYWCMKLTNIYWYKDNQLLINTVPCSENFVYTLELNKRSIRNTDI